MSSPEKPTSPVSSISIPSSLYNSSTSESYALLNEKLNFHHYVRRMPMRHRAWCLLLSMSAAGMLFANLVWKLTPRTHPDREANSVEAQIAWDIGSPGGDNFKLSENIRVVALVSYIARSRTSILDCYLQSNLAINDGPLDQVIFIPETGQERDLDWLFALVQSTPSYYMLGKPRHDSSDDTDAVPIAGEPSTHVSETEIGNGPFARAWNLALSESVPVVETQEDGSQGVSSMPFNDPDSNISTIYIFIHGETIFLAHDTISHLLQTHLASPTYTFTHANVVNQPVLSWIHHHQGVVRPYRPEVEPPLRMMRNKTIAAQDKAAVEKANRQHPWRASELPLWRDSHASKKQEPSFTDEHEEDFPPIDGPTLFNVPIDFHSPFRGHRWLPYHPSRQRQSNEELSDPEDNPGISNDQALPPDVDTSISTPITQAMMSLSRPGKWPWTLSALHLYSFLEHVECTPPHTSAEHLSTTPNDSTSSPREKYTPSCTLTGPLSRYNFNTWEYQSEHYGTSVFAISSSTVQRIGALPVGVSEAEILLRSGCGAIIDGGAVAVRFVGASGVEGVSEMRGLESTDLLQRFESLGREIGGCEVDGGL